MYNWIPVLYTWNLHNLEINYTSIKKKTEKKIKMQPYFQCEMNPQGISTVDPESPCLGPFGPSGAFFKLLLPLLEWEVRELGPWVGKPEFLAGTLAGRGNLPLCTVLTAQLPVSSSSTECGQECSNEKLHALKANPVNHPQHPPTGGTGFETEVTPAEGDSKDVEPPCLLGTRWLNRQPSLALLINIRGGCLPHS